MVHPKTLMIGLAAVLAGCAAPMPSTVDPALPSGDPRQAVLVEQECAIYFAARAKLQAEGRRLAADPTRGCPQSAAARPADINPMISVPSVSPGFPQDLYNRMIARGLPADLADDIAKSKAFWDLVARRDSAVGTF